MTQAAAGWRWAPQARIVRPDLVRAYAAVAASAGWTDRSLADFCDRSGLSPRERAELWPGGARSVARAWTTLADQDMLEQYSDFPALNFQSLILNRFVQHADDKPSVIRLAHRDFWRPLDTLTRTASSADAMWRCRAGPKRASWFDRWRLALAYCACVTAWMSDRSPDLSSTRRATRIALALVGLR